MYVCIFTQSNRLLSHNFFSPGSIIVNLQVSMLSHPQAECFFMSRIHNLNSLFPGSSFGQNTCEFGFCDILKISDYNTLLFVSNQNDVMKVQIIFDEWYKSTFSFIQVKRNLL